MIVIRTGISRNGILEKVRFNKPDGGPGRSKVICHSLSIRLVAIKDAAPVVPNGLGTISAMVGRTHIAIHITLILVVFRNHIGIKHRRQVVLFAGPHHGAFPVRIVTVVVANPNGQVGKTFARKISIFVEAAAPLPTVVKMTFVKGGESKRCKK